MNWTALYAILKNSINTTKAELEQEITEKIGLTNQFLDELPESGESGVLYFIPKDNVDPSAEDQYFMYVWDPDNTEFVLLDPDVDLSPYAKSADLATVATSGLYSDLSGTPDLTPYITEAEADEKYMSGDVLDDETVTGNPVTFESLDGGNVEQCEVSFGPEQDLHGYESPWPAGGGKNKCPYFQSTTIQGRVWSVSDDGVITITGTSTGNSYKMMNITLPAGTYILSGGDPNGAAGVGDEYVQVDGTVVARSYGSLNQSFTITEEKTVALAVRDFQTAGNSDTHIFKPMIRLSTETDASYAPYSNICPISGRDSLSLNCYGKNFFHTTATSGSAGGVVYNVNSDGTIDVSGTATGSTSFVIGEALVNSNMGIVVISGISTATNIAWNSIQLFDENDIVLRTISGGSTTPYFSIDLSQYPTAYKIKCTTKRNNNGVVSGTIKPQVELNSQPTIFEPYITTTTHTATFPDTVYGGKWLPQEGKAVITHAFITYNGTEENWSKTSNRFVIPKPNNAEIGDTSGIANWLTEAQGSSTQKINAFYIGNFNLGIVLENGADLSVDQFKALLVANNLQICYKLATSTEITLTAEQIELLKGINTLWTDGDNIKLTAAQLELVKVIANPSGQATGTLEKLQVNDEIFDIPAELPEVASSDEGKVLTVNSSGEWEAADIPVQVEANPADTATTDLTKLGVRGTVYGIPAAPTIAANPSGAATDILDKLQVGSTVYATPKQMDYSTAEQKTGVKWIDGRDIYQRTFVKTLASSPDADASSFLIASGLDTIDVLIDISGTVKGNGVHAFCGTTGLINGNGWKYSIHLDSDDQLVVWAGSSSDYYSEIAGGKAYITIKYVKNLYSVSDPWPTGAGYGIGNFEWDDQMTADIAADAHSWDSRYFGSDDPWWIKYISTNLDGSINVKAQHAWMDEEPESANHFTFNKYYEPFYITTDTFITYGCYAWASYTVAQDGTITRTGADYERCDVEPKLYIRSTDSYLTQINDEWFFKMYQEIPGYLIYANWSKLSNWLVEGGNYQHIKEPLWKVN